MGMEGWTFMYDSLYFIFFFISVFVLPPWSGYMI